MRFAVRKAMIESVEPSNHEISPQRHPYRLVRPEYGRRPSDESHGRFRTNLDCRTLFHLDRRLQLRVRDREGHQQAATRDNRLVDAQIGISRRKRAADQCFGKPIKALAVTYRSAPGYHGPDYFTLDATFHAYREVDTFTINVR